jgi:ZIP family zinc transporter
VNPGDAYVAIPAASTILGGLVASLWRPREGGQAAFQHLAAGIVLAAATIEVIPEIERSKTAPLLLLLAFCVGCLAMFALSWFTKAREKKAGGASMGLILASGVDIFVDGLTVGAGLRVGAGLGLLLAVGVAFEVALLGLTAATEMGEGGSRWRPLGLSAVFALVLILGAVLGVWVLGALPLVATHLVLAFGAAALLYLVAEELLVEAHEVPDPARNTLVLFAGFVAFWLLRIALPD